MGFEVELALGASGSMEKIFLSGSDVTGKIFSGSVVFSEIEGRLLKHGLRSA